MSVLLPLRLRTGAAVPVLGLLGLTLVPVGASPAAGPPRPPDRAAVVLAGQPGPRWVAPLPLRVARPFRPPVSRYGVGHRGVDLFSRAGAPVHAAGAGTVVHAGLLAGRPVVSVEHPGGLRTTYEPVEAGVGRGERVTAGQVLGVLGPVHAGCGACLHWGLRRGGSRGPEYLDPLALLRSGPSRLLPMGGDLR